MKRDREGANGEDIFLVFLNHKMLKHAWQLQQQTIYGYEMVSISFFCYVGKKCMTTSDFVVW
jgi:hypothetical protein